VRATKPEPDLSAGPAGEVFLSYHSPDRAALLRIRELLATRGVGTFLDRDNLIAGMPWPQALERALGQARAVAVFLGAHGVGLWQKREIGYALDRQVSAERDGGEAFPVIPVLLPGADPAPGFLFLNTWIDLRKDVGDPESIDALARAIRGVSSQEASPTALALCPYRGLKAFTEEDRGLFFGREKFVPRLLEAVQRHRFVAVVGPSGRGKSSVVHAGLFPLLRAQRPPAATWDMASFAPTDQPFHALAAALIGMLEPELGETDRIAEAKKLGDRLAAGEVALEAVVSRALAKSGGSDRLLLVVDQFEELFNRTGAAERERLVAMLLGAIERAPLTVLIALRASFYAHSMASSAALRGHFERASITLEPMAREDMKRAVLEPARRVALEFERGLVERILDDVADEPGNLALLEFALTRLWDKRQGRTLTHAAYDEIKSAKGAIVQQAEAFLLGLGPTEQIQARRILTRLWAPGGPDGRLGIRSRALVAELGEERWPLIKALADARLVVTAADPASGLDTLELAHDALIHDWERFTAWLAEDREFLVWRAKLVERIADWEAGGRDEARLLHGAEIEQARGWREQRPDELAPAVTEFIRHSSGKRERDLVARVGRQRRLLAGMAAGAALLVVLGAAALFQWRQVEAQRKMLDSRDLAAKALGQIWVDPELAMMIAVRAFDSTSTPEAQDALRKSLLESRVRAVMRGHANLLTSLALSPDGALLATASSDRTVRLWETASGKQVSQLGEDLAARQRLVFSPRGERLLAVGADGVARIWDRGELKTKSAGPPGAVLATAWIAAEDAPLVLSAGPAGSVRLWHAHSGAEAAQLLEQPGGIRQVAVSRDGRLIASGGQGAVRLWDRRGKLLAELARPGLRVSTLAFSEDGAALAIGALDGSVRLWETLQRRRESVLGRHAASVAALAFSPNGGRLASAGEDNAVRVWNAADHALLHELRAHSDTVLHVAFSGDGHYLATAGIDSLCAIWDVTTGVHVAELRGHTDVITGVAFAPDAPSGEKMVVTISNDRTARVWAAVTSQDWTVLRGHIGAVDAVQFSPDGTHLLTAGGDDSPRLWDLSTRKNERRLRGHSGSIMAAHYSPNGALAVTASRDDTARVWDTATGKPLAELAGHTDAVRDARFSPDGSRVATAANDGTARIWDARSGEPRGELRGHGDRVYSVMFSPDGRLVASASGDHTARIWDLVTGATRILSGHKASVRTAAFSPDGSLLATASDDGTARVWQVYTGQGVAELVHRDAVRSVEFSRDGRSLLTVSWDGSARVWEAPGFKLRRAFVAHATKLSAAALSPDGTLLATSDWDADAIVHVWNVATGELVCALSGHRDRVMALAFSPDGRLLATASRDATVRLWAADTAGPAAQAYPCEACGPLGQVLELAKKRATRPLTPAEEFQYLRK
jgi:WD40 repeat protein